MEFLKEAVSPATTGAAGSDGHDSGRKFGQMGRWTSTAADQAYKRTGRSNVLRAQCRTEASLASLPPPMKKGEAIKSQSSF